MSKNNTAEIFSVDAVSANELLAYKTKQGMLPFDVVAKYLEGIQKSYATVLNQARHAATYKKELTELREREQGYSTQSEEIAKALIDAHTQSTAIINDANSKAKDIIDDANANRDKILTDASTDANAILEQAHNDVDKSVELARQTIDDMIKQANASAASIAEATLEQQTSADEFNQDIVSALEKIIPICVDAKWLNTDVSQIGKLDDEQIQKIYARLSEIKGEKGTGYDDVNEPEQYVETTTESHDVKYYATPQVHVESTSESHTLEQPQPSVTQVELTESQKLVPSSAQSSVSDSHTSESQVVESQESESTKPNVPTYSRSERHHNTEEIELVTDDESSDNSSQLAPNTFGNIVNELPKDNDVNETSGHDEDAGLDDEIPDMDELTRKAQQKLQKQYQQQEKQEKQEQRKLSSDNDSLNKFYSKYGSK